jgi:subtilisin-like proprotein convertase family protein
MTPPRPARKSPRARPSSKPYRARLHVEGLEARTVPTLLTYSSTEIPKSIPDNTTIVSRLTVGDNVTIGDLDVNLSINHTYDEDLAVRLIAPDGTPVQLFAGVGREFNNFTNTRLDDGAATAITAGAAPFNGTFRPQGLLADFVGKSARGTWTLEVRDTATQDMGTLNSWSLAVTTAAVFTSTNVPLPIPQVGTITSTLVVPTSFSISDLNVRLNANHTIDADLDVSLRAPDGTIVELFTDVGGSGDNFTKTTLDDESARSVTAGTAPFTGAFRPKGNLSAFDGRNAQGTWTLTITDDTAAASGTLLDWSLVFERPFVAAANLRGDGFLISPGFANWGSAVSVNYAVVNAGGSPSGPTTAQIRLSSNATISGSDVLLATVAIPALATGQRFAGTTTVTLPGSFGAPPPGFTEPASVFLGLILDPANLVVETNETDNANLGNGFDRVPLTVPRTREVESNNTPDLADSITPGGTIFGSIGTAADIDYFSFTVTQAGYLTATVTPRNGSGLDARLDLSQDESILVFDDLRIGSGGYLLGSDDRAPGVADPLITYYVLPGTYYLAVSGSNAAATGDYSLLTTLTVDPADPHDADDVLLSRLVVGDDPRSLVVADFNLDNILDLATVNRGSGDVSVLLGVGDATFQPARTYALTQLADPRQLVAADYNGDGRLDLVAADPNQDQVQILLGEGDGRFVLPDALLLSRNDPLVRPLQNDPTPIPSDGRTLRTELVITEDLEIRNLRVGLDIQHPYVENLSVFLVGPDGTRVELFSGVGGDGDNISQLVLDDTAADSIADANAPLEDFYRPIGQLGVFEGRSLRGTWALEVTDASPDGDNGTLRNWSLIVNEGKYFTNYPATIATGDFNRDGNLDAANLTDADQNGVNDPRIAMSVGAPSGAEAFVDITQSQYYLILSLLVGLDDLTPASTFAREDFRITADRNPSNPSRATPLMADLTGDGVVDVLEVNRTGEILVRAGVAGQPGTFAPAVVVNADLDLPRARAVAALPASATAPGRIAAIDLEDENVSIYAFDGTDYVPFQTGLVTGLVPGQVAAGDLDGDGHLDLVVGNQLLGSVSVFLATADGQFGEALNIKVGITISDVQLDDLDIDGDLDVLLADVASSTVSVLTNLGGAAGTVSFAGEQRYRAGDTGDAVYGGVEGVTGITNDLVTLNFGFPDAFPHQYFTYARHETSGMASGDMDGDGNLDLVAVNRLSGTVTMLTGKSGSGFADPVVVATAQAPSVVRMGDFDGDEDLDLAVLDEATATILVLTNDGSGTMTLVDSAAAGIGPTGFSVADVTAPSGGGPDGILDLLVGNEFGDLFILAGTGTGEFERIRPASNTVTLDVTRVGTDVQVLLADRSQTEAVVQRGDPGTNPDNFATLTADRLLAPGAVFQARLDQGDGPDNLLVAAGASNTVYVYRLAADGGSYDPPQAFFVGTDPAAIEVADVDGDGILDLAVANRGSNDVSILLGRYNANGLWTAVPGARSPSGGIGPMALRAQDVDGDGLPELLVTNTGGGENGTGVRTTLNNRTNGLFDLTPTNPVALGGTPVVVNTPPTPATVGATVGVPNLDVGIRSDNSLFVITPTGTITNFALATPQSAVALQALATPFLGGSQLIATIGAGGIGSAFLNTGAGGGFAPIASLFTSVSTPTGFALADFDSPSALSILETEGGIFLYATTAGVEGVFVFQLGLDTDPGNADNPGGPGNPGTPSVLAGLPATEGGTAAGPILPTFNLTPTLTAQIVPVAAGGNPAPIIATPVFSFLAESGDAVPLPDADIGPADVATGLTTLLAFEEGADSTGDSGTEEEVPEEARVEEPSARLSSWESLLFGLSEWPEFLDKVPAWPGLLRAAGDTLDVLGFDDLTEAVVDAAGPGAAALLDALGLAPATTPAPREDVRGVTADPSAVAGADVALEELAVATAPIRVAIARTPDVRRDLGAEVLLPAAALLYRPLFGRAQRSAAHRTPAVREAAR